MTILMNPCRCLGFFITAALLSPIIARGQIRCNLQVEGCLDPRLINGDAYQVPSNVTRFEEDGITVCVPAVEGPAIAADVMFVVDQSGSMTSNDADFATPVVTRAAMDTLLAKAPNSVAGYLGFAKGVCDGKNTSSDHGAGARLANPPNTVVQPLPINHAPSFARLTEQTDYNLDNYYFDCGNSQFLPGGGGTNYYRAFLAADSLLAGLDGPHPEQAIIFLTDGEPNSEVPEFINFAQSVDTTTFPRVFALFITDDMFGDIGRQALEELARRTGGKFHTIPRNDPAALSDIMRFVLGQVLPANLPLLTQVTNLTNGQTAAADGAAHTQLQAEHFRANLDNAIALGVAQNQLQLVNHSEQAKPPEASATFTINVGLDSVRSPGIVPIANTPFSAECVQATALAITTLGFVPVQDLDFLSTSFGVTLQNTTDGDLAPVTLSVPGQGDQESLSIQAPLNRGTVQFDGNASSATPSNSIVEGALLDLVQAVWQHPRDIRDVATVTVPIVDRRDFDPLLATIHDEDGDGRAETVIIEFKNAIAPSPFRITDINWPQEGQDPREGLFDLDDPNSNITFIAANKIRINLRGAPFAEGATAPSTALPPLLTLPNGAPTLIVDRVGAVILGAEKRPSGHKPYLQLNADGRKTHMIFPDTLVLTLSEPLIPTIGGEPWKTALEFYRDCDSSQAPLELDVLAAPITGTFDSLTWMVLFPADVETANIKTGDCVRFTQNAQYADIAGNSPSRKSKQVGGRDSETIRLISTLLEPLISSVDYIPKSNPNTSGIPGDTRIPVFDLDGNPMGEEVYNPSSDLFDETGSVPMKWIRPVALDPVTWTVDETAQRNCPNQTAPMEPEVDYPRGCLSSVIVFSEGPYQADINIYDHLGKFVHHSLQSFGYCGELKNPFRRQSAGLVSFLIWNQKDNNGEYVESGVYLWKVVFHFEGGRTKKVIYKQGIARDVDPSIMVCP